MELKILSGNNLAEKSDKADEDDMMKEILEKYGSQSKKSKDQQILTSWDEASWDDKKELLEFIFGHGEFWVYEERF